MDINFWYLIIMAVFLAFSAFFSSSEAAFLSVRRLRLRHLEATGVKGAQRVLRMVEQPEKLLPTILLGNNLVNVGFASIATALFVSLLGQGRGVTVATIAGTIALLILGETIPKTLAIRHAERTTFLYAQPLRWIGILFFPIVVTIEVLNRGATKLFRGSPRSLVTEEEIKVLISVGQRAGEVEWEEAEMLQKVFRFGDMQVREIMTPRVEIVWVEKGTPLRKFLDIYAEHYHTRFPVFEEDEDSVIGVLSVKDVLKALSQTGISEDTTVTEIMREAFFVPETKLTASLFDEMRKAGHQMAMVVDEYGGISGLVTLKQLVEEIVGRVGEEGEQVEEEYQAIDENTFQVDGGMSVADANLELSLGIPEGDYDTVAGFILETLGRIPKAGDHFHLRNLQCEVLEMNGHKIETVRLYRSQPSLEEPHD